MSDDPRSLLSSIDSVLSVGAAVRLAIVFGSAARDAMRPDSDVDIGVIFSEHADLAPLLERSARTYARRVAEQSGAK